MNIYYGVCGEGCGHAGRSLTVIRELIYQGHDVDVFTYGDAYDFFHEHFANVHKIPGLRFSQMGGKISYHRTAFAALKFVYSIGNNLELFETISAKRPPELCITDYEPLVPRFAKLKEVPCISIDNQHKFLIDDDSLPPHLNAYCKVASVFTKWMVPSPTQCIISTFHKCKPQKGFFSTNIMVRDEIRSLNPTDGRHVLVYVKDYVQKPILDALKSIDQRFLVYGSKGYEPSPNLEFKPASNRQFAEDLASAKAVVCCAGNQLIGEARHFAKPVFAIPIPNQQEQEINAHYVKVDGLGDSCSLHEVTSEKIEAFLNTTYTVKPRQNGTPCVMAALKPYLR